MDKYVIRNFKRPSEEMIEAYKELDVSTVYEAQGKKGLVNHEIRPVQSDTYIVGPAVTVACRGDDNLMIHAAMETCKPGDVLVVTAIGGSSAGMIGELIVLALQRLGVKGLIIEAGMRDLARVKELGFPVWSKAISSKGTTKLQGGTVNGEVVCGDTIIRAGDLVLADDDGIVVVDKQETETALERSRARLEKEEKVKKRIADGELSVDFYGLRETLKKENVRYFDTIEDFKTVNK